jgi:hypothetical protein
VINVVAEAIPAKSITAMIPSAIMFLFFIKNIPP